MEFMSVLLSMFSLIPACLSLSIYKVSLFSLISVIISSYIKFFVLVPSGPSNIAALRLTLVNNEDSFQNFLRNTLEEAVSTTT